MPEPTEPRTPRRWLGKARVGRAGVGLLGLSAFVVAAVLALAVAWATAAVVEHRTEASVSQALMLHGLDWAHVSVDGLQVALGGTAPDEPTRALALSVAGGVVDPGRLRDTMAVAPAQPIAPPRFSVEILRNDDGVQLIGLLPDGGGRDRLAAAAQALMTTGAPTDMLEVAAYPVPEGWDAALDYAAHALALLPRSKISVSADGVAITALAASADEKQSLESDLAQAAPKGMPLQLKISAPRPVLTPFTLRFIKDEKGARFDACSADTEAAAARIVAAGVKAGAAADPSNCTVGMGVPSPRWAEATSAAIASVGQLSVASVTFSDADVTLLAGPGVAQADFDRVVGDLRNVLPDVFSLDAKLQAAGEAPPTGPAEFTADLAADSGRIELRGLLTSTLSQDAVAAFAKLRFGPDKVYLAARIDPELPDGWPERVLTGLLALAEVHDGRLVVREDTVAVTGHTGAQGARAKIAQILSEGLGQGQTFAVDVTYDKALDPLAALPTPDECLTRVNAVVSRQKIAFDPGSAEIAAASAPVLDAIAAALNDCNGLRMEIGGHTDAQGSESGNRTLSQARAEAVMVALQGRQVDVSAMRAVGYGESRPIADNSTDIGREANRRIEFSLIGAAPSALRAEPAAASDPLAVPLADPAQDPAAPPAGDAGAQGSGLPANTVLPKPRPKT